VLVATTFLASRAVISPGVAAFVIYSLPPIRSTVFEIFGASVALPDLSPWDRFMCGNARPGLRL